MAGSAALAELERRATALEAIAARLRAAEDELVELCGSETGLPEGRRRAELARTCFQLDAFAAVVRSADHVDAIIDHADPDATPVPRPDVRRMLVPLGPVAVFGASNFPFAFSTAGGDTASALAAGCPVIVKGHPAHPGTSSASRTRSRRRSRAPDCRPARSPTCSRPSTRSAERSSSTPRSPPSRSPAPARRARADGPRRRAAGADPVFAEMGSLNPVVVTRAALAARADAIVAALTASVADFGGQMCTKPGLVFVPAGDGGDAFAVALAEALGAREPEVLLTEAILAGLERA